MRAVICRAWGAVDDLRIEDVPAPTPADDEVLIDVRATSVNYADSIIVAGKYHASAFPVQPRPRDGYVLDTGGAEQAAAMIEAELRQCRLLRP